MGQGLAQIGKKIQHNHGKKGHELVHHVHRFLHLWCCKGSRKHGMASYWEILTAPPI